MFLFQHPALLFLIAIAVVGVAAASKAMPTAKNRRAGTSTKRSSSDDARSQSQSSEREFTPMKVLTDTESRFFRQLQSVLADELIFPQVAMSALIKPTGRGRQYWSSFGKISQKRVDFAIFRKDLSLVAVVELDDPSHDRRVEEDLQRDEYLKSAGIRTVRFDVRKWPDDAAVRGKIYPSVARPAARPSAPALAAAGGTVMPPPDVSPVTQNSLSA